MEIYVITQANYFTNLDDFIVTDTHFEVDKDKAKAKFMELIKDLADAEDDPEFYENIDDTCNVVSYHSDDGLRLYTIEFNTFETENGVNMIRTFRNLDYHCGTDLVRCNQCDTLMFLPSDCGVCPVCGDTHCLEDIDREVEGISGDEEVVTDDALYRDSGEIDDEGYSVPELVPNVLK